MEELQNQTPALLLYVLYLVFSKKLYEGGDNTLNEKAVLSLKKRIKSPKISKCDEHLFRLLVISVD